MAQGWRRIAAQAEMRSPAVRYLTVASLGWAGPTRSGGAEEENRNRLEEEQKRPERWRGKILLLAPKGKSAEAVDIFGQMGPFLKSAHASGALAVIDADGTPETRGKNLTQVDLAARASINGKRVWSRRRDGLVHRKQAHPNGNVCAPSYDATLHTYC